MKPLIDADLLVYEAASSAEIGWRSDGIAPFDYVEGLLENYVLNICASVRATEEPLFFLSTDNNFRYDIAVTKPYKGNRNHSARPFHFDNIRAYIPARWKTVICEGYEADDGLAMAQTEAIKNGVENTIICSRDKDLRMIPGWHFSWGMGLQEYWGPNLVDYLGEVSIEVRDVIPKDPAKRPYKKYKCRGTGIKFFYAQCIMGDPTDNIPGLKGTGDLVAFNTINPCNSELECHKAVLKCYKQYGGDEILLLEQARLLWMVRERNEDGTLKMWTPPTEG